LILPVGEGSKMKLLREMGGRLSIAGELLGFIWRRKMWWLMPIVMVLLFMGLLIGFGSASGVGPFIYTLF
jgi:hypothetical protein